MITLIKILIAVVFGAIYIPLNWFFMKLQKWYLPLEQTDKVLFYLVAPLYWTFVAINSIIGVPYEKIAESIH
jgi:hypothetical protein